MLQCEAISLLNHKRCAAMDAELFELEKIWGDKSLKVKMALCEEHRAQMTRTEYGYTVKKVVRNAFP